ncbi:MAG: hypothetical protein HKO76_03915, partial [Acidimicrobiia bacterium]|nr:hypothetical protein [Acidimicrobiia bacterium]
DLKAALDAVNETDLSNIIGQVNQLAQSLADALANAVALNQELNSVDGSLQEGQEFSGGNIPIGNTFESGVPLPFAGE